LRRANNGNEGAEEKLENFERPAGIIPLISRP
jgi:hypothetical protein